MEEPAALDPPLPTWLLWLSPDIDVTFMPSRVLPTTQADPPRDTASVYPAGLTGNLILGV